VILDKDSETVLSDDYPSLSVFFYDETITIQIAEMKKTIELEDKDNRTTVKNQFASITFLFFISCFHLLCSSLFS